MTDSRYWKIVIHYANGKKNSGIRMFNASDEEEAKTKIWEIIHKKIGRWKVEYLEVRELNAEHPEVQAFRVKCIAGGKTVPGLQKLDN